MNAFAMESALLRTQKLARKQKGENAADMTAVFLREAMETVESSARTVLAACSEGDALRMNLVGARSASRSSNRWTPSRRAAASRAACSGRSLRRLKIVITVGLPGSGKSTYLARRGVNAISSDEIRRLLADDPRDQSIHERVFATIRYLVRQRIAIGRRVTYVDATHLTRWERRPYVLLARRHDVLLEALYFDVPLETCIRRNRGRDRLVPVRAIRAMAERLEPPSKAEGFARVTRVRPGR